MEISANIRLRPTRIGFLVEPTDMASVRKIMRICSSLWGGAYNPIIPVYQKSPPEWRPEKHEHIKGYNIAKGYINFFEPDVFVEAKSGLIEKAGLQTLKRERFLEPTAITLEQMFTKEKDRDWREFAFGTTILEVYRHLYREEFRFEQRGGPKSILFKEVKDSGLTEVLFGSFPKQSGARYLSEGFKNAFNPEVLDLTPEGWLKVFKENSFTPLSVTRFGLDVEKYNSDGTIYIFDPQRTTDLIDLWNMRIEPHTVLPIPIDWFDELKGFVREEILAEFRPIRGNPNGVMHRCTIEFSRSISEDKRAEVLKKLGKNFPSGALCVKHWRNRVWEPQDQEYVVNHQVVKITAKEESTSLVVIEESRPVVKYKTLEPDFADKYESSNWRWVNALHLKAYSSEKYATILPFNNYDREWPKLTDGGDDVRIGKEGWVFGQKYKNWTDTIPLLTKEEAIIGYLKRLSIKSKLSDAGHITKQVIEHLGGHWGINLLANRDILKLLNEMATSIRRRKNESFEDEVNLEGKTVPEKRWKEIIQSKKQSLRNANLEDYTKSNVIRLGIETTCTNCHGKNWHSLTDLGYQVPCSRCLNEYSFPQASEGKKNWMYRVVGPFSLPDYAKGAYSTLLTIRALDSLTGQRREMTVSTSLDLEFANGKKAEADFVLLQRNDRIGDYSDEPELLIGECKSFGDGDLIKEKDIEKIKLIASHMPGSIIVISVMRDNFTKNEKKLLKKLVEWGRRPNKRWRASHPVILMTGHELFAEYHIGTEWKKLGKPYSDHSGIHSTRSLYSFAFATQAIHLDLPHQYDWLAEKKKARKKRDSF